MVDLSSIRRALLEAGVSDAERAQSASSDGQVGEIGYVMAEVVMTVGNVEIVAGITRGSAEQLAIKADDAITAIIKSTEVIIDKS
jgi:molybdopterin-binding protein